MTPFLLATDLDRTLLPNGPAPDDGGISALFSALAKTEHILAYVTGRNLAMVHDAQKQYGIPTPDYLIAEVGTRMFRQVEGALVPDEGWIDYVAQREPSWDRDKITKAIGTEQELSLQEPEVQNRFKISYYLPAHAHKGAALAHINKALAHVPVDANVVWSVDPLKNNVGLIDVLPKTATKATALEFLRVQEKLEKKDVIYCGDSGNDILPLTQCYNSILVKNAPEDVQQSVRKIVEEKGCAARLYVAVGKNGRNGNYASGILEGLRHFHFVPS